MTRALHFAAALTFAFRSIAFIHARGRMSFEARSLHISASLEEVGGILSTKIGIIICDHGSRRENANDMLSEVALRFKQCSEERKSDGGQFTRHVEIAHMELAKPAIEDAFDRCVASGCLLVICHPFFLSPGRHVTRDIPELMAAAASKYSEKEIKWKVTEPLGLAPLMPELMNNIVDKAIVEALQ